jgi:hypothetical protein
MCRMLVGDSGRQVRDRHRSSHTCSRGVRWSMPWAPVQWTRHRRSSAYRESSTSASTAPAFEPADEEADVLSQVLCVHPPGRPTGGEGFEVAVEQLVKRPLVREFRRSSTWLSILVRAASASAAAFGAGGITSTRSWRLPVSGSSSPYRRTRRAPLGSWSIAPRCRRRPGPDRVMTRRERHARVTFASRREPVDNSSLVRVWCAAGFERATARV